MRRRTGFIGSGVVAAVALTAVAVGSAAGDGAAVTSGEFHAFAVGAGLPITGNAHMVRTADGKTIVSIELAGLEPGVTYAAHVHAAACAAGEADGHYRLVPSGPA